MAFVSTLSEEGTAVIFHLAGKLVDENDARTLNDTIELEIQSGKKYVIFSLENLAHCNSTGINIFIKSLTKTRIHGGEAFLVNIHPELNELLKITRVHEIFNIYSSLEEVLKIIQSNNA